MITPNKSTPLKNSIIYKMTYILDVEFDELPLVELYKTIKGKFDTIDEFIYSVDALYVLGKIDLDVGSGRIIKC